ncbi:hypothetical protein BDV93DRAFT_566792 [Ceratobasidium sp. AG-I]|nr:hypothetical protein BDV93DRAFT_566792 [Ceratobasidium sp. AG-I]
MSRWEMFVTFDWGTPLDVYLARNKNLSMRQYPLDAVLSAIRTITIKNTSDVVHESTLEAFLSVIYYPKYLNLLVTKTFRKIWFTLMDKYNSVHEIYDRSFGLLMTQVLGLTTMIGLLAHNKKLELFVGSLLESKPQGADEFFRCLNLQAVQITKLDTQTLAVVLGRNDNFLGLPFDREKLAGFLPNIGGFTAETTMFLNQCLFEARHKFLSTIYHTRPCGWPMVLFVIVREASYRYFLVCTPEERPIMETLVREAASGVTREIDLAKDSNDARMIILAPTRQLPCRSAHPTPQSLYCLTVLSKYAAAITRSFVDDLYPDLLSTGFNRIWAEFPADPIGVLGIDLCNHLLYLANTLMKHARDSFESQRVIIPEVISALATVDLVGLAGRLIIVHASLDDTFERRGL